MDFWNFAIAGSILLAPILAGIWAVRSDSNQSHNTSLVLFGILALISVVSIFKFDVPINLSFLWPVTSEPSGYFNFSLKLHWANFLWILLASGSLVSYLIYENGRENSVDLGHKKTIFLFSASIFSSLAFLSENIFLALFFVEITYFLIFSLVLISGKEGIDAERSSYFKRAIFIFFSLICLLALTILGKVSTMAILLLGSLLYITATIFSRHSFSSWSTFFLNVLQFSLLFFLNERVVNEEYSTELLFYFSLIFSFLSVFFSTFSILASKKIDSCLWLLLSVVVFLLFSRLSTTRPVEFVWIAFEVIGLAAATAIVVQLRYVSKFTSSILRASNIGLLFLLLSFLTGALPAIDQSVIKAKADISLRMILGALITFLLSAAVGKMISTPEKIEGKQERASNIFLTAFAPSVLVVLIFLGVAIKLTQLFGEGPFHSGLLYVLVSPHVIIHFSAIFLGMLIGYFLGLRVALQKWSSASKIQMEFFFPNFESSSLVFWESIPSKYERFSLRFRGVFYGASQRMVRGFETGDRWVFGERVYFGVMNQGLRFSSLLKKMHSGNARYYLFAGILIVLISSGLFLWEAR
jgi:hypothetical protein